MTFSLSTLAFKICCIKSGSVSVPEIVCSLSVFLLHNAAEADGNQRTIVVGSSPSKHDRLGWMGD